ncbi:MAG TPA: hypothetical protein VG056_16430, partial [Pirellulales bacterium]|nr:hypothetical protein [Pirellulales bacterium]
MRDGSRTGGAMTPRRMARWAIVFAIFSGGGMFQSTAMAQDINSSAFDDLKRVVEQQQQQIRQLQAQAANQQQPMAQSQTGQIPAVPTGYGDPAPAAAASTGLPPGAAVVTNEKTPLNLYWNNGLQAESANKEFTLHVSGFMEWDAGAYHAPSSTVTELRAINTNGFANFQDNIDFRRARLRVDGTIYENIDFVAEYEYADSFAVVRPNHAGPGGTLSVTAANSTTSNRNNTFEAACPTNVYCTVKDIPLLGNVRTGQFLYKFSFELATSDRWCDFIERSAAFDAFVPSSNTGNFM